MSAVLGAPPTRGGGADPDGTARSVPPPVRLVRRRPTGGTRATSAGHAWALALALGGLLLVSGATFLPGGSAASRPGASLAPADVGSAVPPRPNAVTIGQTSATSVLFNSTVVPGNPTWPVNGENPVGVALDTVNDTAWVAAFGSNSVGVIDPDSGSGLRWIPVQKEPWGVVYDNDSDSILVSNYGSATVTVINATSYAVRATIGVGSGPMGMAYDWENDSIFVANYLSSNVTILSGTHLTVEASVGVGLHPSAAAFDPDLDEVFVANFGSTTVSILNASSQVSTGSLTVGGDEPQSILVDPVPGTLYVGTTEGVAIVNLTTGAQTGTVTGAVDATGFVSVPSSGIVYAIGTGDNSSGEVDGIATANATVVVRIGVGQFSDPQEGTYVPSVREVLVSCRNSDDYEGSNLTAVSPATNRTVGAIPLEHLPTASVYSALHDAVYVYDGGSGSVEEVNATTYRVERTRFVGYTPLGLGYNGNGIALDPGTDRLYVDWYNYLQHGITVLDAANLTVVTTVGTGALTVAAQAGIAVDPTDHAAFVANYYSDTVTVVDTQTESVEGTVGVGYAPGSVLWDPATDAVYVANYFSSNLTVIDGHSDRVVANVTVGPEPRGLALDPASGRVYVANGDPQVNVSVVSGTTQGVVDTIPLHLTGSPMGASFDPRHGTVLLDLSHGPQTNGTVALVNDSAGTVAPAVAVTPAPVGLSYDATAGSTVASGEWNGTLSVVTVTARAGTPLALTGFSADPSAIALGNASTFSVRVSGGILPLTFHYSTLPPDCASVNLSALVCLPAVLGDFVVGVNVTDSVGERAAATTELLVVNPASLLAITSFSVSPTPVTLGGSTQFTVTTRGGTPPFLYLYSGLPVGCQPSDVPSFSCTPLAVGNFSVVATVSDVTGREVNATTTITVRSLAVAPLAVTAFWATPANLSPNSTTDLHVLAHGGMAPIHFAYSGLPPGCASADVDSLNCTPNAPGHFVLHVTVTDAQGRSVSAQTNLTVGGSIPGVSASPPGTSDGLLALGVASAAGGAAVVLILLLYRRRRAAREEEAAGPPEDEPEPPEDEGVAP